MIDNEQAPNVGAEDNQIIVESSWCKPAEDETIVDISSDQIKRGSGRPRKILIGTLGRLASL